MCESVSSSEVYVLIKTGYYFNLASTEFCCKVEHAEIIHTEA